jgi:glycosyltransferase involved in cell wall biosynthesis
MVQTVVLVSEAADAKGGASVVALQSARILARAGLEVRLFAGIGPFHPADDDPSSLTVRTLTDGGDLIRAPLLTRATRSLWNADAADRFAEFTRDLDPGRTAVHVHSFQFQLTGSVIRRAAASGFPVVMTAHDYGIACPYGGFFDYRTGAPCGKRALSLGCVTTLCNESRSVSGKLWHVGKEWLQRHAGQVPSALRHLAFVSEFSRTVLGPYLPPDLPTSVVRNPVAVEPGPPRDLPPGAPFLFVGRLTREKGGETFARAAREAGVPAVVVGAGGEEDRIRAANPEVECVGWLNAGEVRARMRQARALVFPSLWYEAQPLVVQEARAVGLPVIVATGCASTETVEDGVDGLHFRAGDAADLAEKLRRMDDGAAERMGRAAHARFWADPPTPARHLEQTLALYAQVLGDRP